MHNLSSAQLLDEILMIPVLKEQNPVFFVDLCSVTSDQIAILPVVKLATKATTMGWYVVLAYSGGWMNDKSIPVSSAINRRLNMLDSTFSHLKSTVFNEREAKKFIDTFCVDNENLVENHIEVANNPYLLHCFRNTVSDKARFEVSIRWFWKRITELSERFISTLNNEVYTEAFNGCLVFLECARHNVYLSNTQLELYQKSYLHKEYLTMLQHEDNGTRVILIFPPMYNIIVTKLKERFKKHNKVLDLPIVQGYMFENRFLQCQDLHSLTIHAVAEEAVSVKIFSFSTLISASAQETGPISCDLIDNEIRHLTKTSRN